MEHPHEWILLHAQRLKQHKKIWWLAGDDESSQPLEFMLDDVEPESFDRMMERLDRADTHGPSGSSTMFNWLGDGMYEFKLNDPQVVRLYAIRTAKGYVIVYGAFKKNTRSQQTDIRRAHKAAEQFRKDGERYV